MAKRLDLLVIVLVAAALFIQSSKAQGTTHVVGGDSLGWNIPSDGASVYTTWAATQNFTVGDVLVFNFATGEHDVAQVTATAFSACSSTSPISIEMNGPTNVTLNSTGEHYFICTVGSHCNNGQKLSINVSAATGTSPSPSPSPSGSTTPSPSPSPSGSTTPPSPSPSPSGSTTPPTPSPSPSGSNTPPSPSPSGSNTPPSPSPSGSTTPPSPSLSPPPPSSAPALVGGAALPVALLFIAVAVLY